MKLRELGVTGAHELEPEPIGDERGFFARTFSEEELDGLGLDGHVAQANCSFNRVRGTLRGLHLQVPPHAETKIVTCTAGRVWDVVADLRPESPTFLRWDAVELSPEVRNQMYVPKGCAHGFVTLADESELRYFVSHPYTPSAEAGVSWDDPALAIEWPVTPEVISERDRSFPPLAVERLRRDGLTTLAATPPA